jgi:hypothetical protein
MREPRSPDWWHTVALDGVARPAMTCCMLAVAADVESSTTGDEEAPRWERHSSAMERREVAPLR